MAAVAIVAAACAALPQCAVRSPAPVPPGATTTGPAPAVVAPVTAADLGASWHPGCPVAPERLRRLTLTHLGFDARPHRGELIVHEQLVGAVIEIFDELYRQGFPIEKMRPAAHYPGADDELSMRDDNTSAFNCRRIPGSGNWALHAYGRAIDVNPLLNPSVSPGRIEPATAGAYRDRRRTEPGLLHAGDPAVRAFTDRGWQWGGAWRSPVDYQHFEHR